MDPRSFDFLDCIIHSSETNILSIASLAICSGFWFAIPIPWRSYDFLFCGRRTDKKAGLTGLVDTRFHLTDGGGYPDQDGAGNNAVADIQLDDLGNLRNQSDIRIIKAMPGIYA